MPARSPSRREMTAYHEAGHAVIGRRIGKRIKVVSIVPDLENKSLGHVIYRPLPIDWRKCSTSARQEAFYLIFFYMAGWVAEQYRWPHLYPELEGEDSERVFVCMRAVCPDLQDDEPTVLFNRLHQRTKEIVVDNWREIDALANALLNSNVLTEKEVNEIIRLRRS